MKESRHTQVDLEAEGLRANLELTRGQLGEYEEASATRPRGNVSAAAARRVQGELFKEQEAVAAAEEAGQKRLGPVSKKICVWRSSRRSAWACGSAMTLLCVCFYYFYHFKRLGGSSAGSSAMIPLESHDTSTPRLSGAARVWMCQSEWT